MDNIVKLLEEAVQILQGYLMIKVT